MKPTAQPESKTYRVIAFSRDRKELLLLPAGARFLLPPIEVPRRQRVAENLTSAMNARWGHDAVCLFPLDVSPSGSRAGELNYQVMQSCHSSKTHESPGTWMPVLSLSQESFADAADYVAIQRSLIECEAHAQCPREGPFARPGWFEQLREWVEKTIRPLGLHLTGRFRQLNASPSFSLIRFETNGPAVWFKAVGEPNLKEFPITLTLARLFPQYLPRILATQPAWNGWIAPEIEGTNLSETQEIVLWNSAVMALAQLQIQSMGKLDAILGSGARDVKASNLANLIHPFLDSMDRLMKEQTNVPPPVLTSKELARLGMQIQNAFSGFEELRIPDTLGSLDLNPGNIVVSSNHCAFLDWAEAYVGHPFFSFQYLLEHFRRAPEKNSAHESELTRSYLKYWERWSTADNVAEALTFSPLLAVFAYAVASHSWASPERLKNPGTAGYLRSLTRRMNREATQLIDRRLPCLC